MKKPKRSQRTDAEQWAEETLPGLEIENVRDSYGVSRKTFAEWLGIGQTTLYYYEQGIRRPDPATCLKLVILSEPGLREYFYALAGLSDRELKKLVEVSGTKLAEIDRVSPDPFWRRMDHYAEPLGKQLEGNEEEIDFLASVLSILRSTSSERDALKAVVSALRRKVEDRTQREWEAADSKSELRRPKKRDTVRRRRTA